MFIYYTIFPIAACISLFNRRLTLRAFLFLWFVLLFKIVTAFGMAYLLINQYNYGDYKYYFNDAIDLSRNPDQILEYFKLHILSGVAVPVILNGILFNFLPPSIYGLALLSGCSSFLYCVLLVRAFEKIGQLPKFALLLIYFSPVLSLQSGYTGKETYLLPLMGLAVSVFITGGPLMVLKLSLVLVAVALIRPYQVVFLAVPMLATWVLFWKTPFKYVFFAMGGLASLAFLLLFSQQLALIGKIESTVGSAYEGGSLTLEPWIFPFSLLQNFRPFPWEAHNALALLASLEYLGWLVALLIGCSFVLRVRRKYAFDRDYRRMLTFAGLSLLSYMFVFQFNENMGDLARRHIYYYPFILALLVRPWPDRKPQHAEV